MIRVKAYREHIWRGFMVVAGNIGNFALTLVRNKLLALYFGPVGIGWIALVNNLNEVGAVLAGTGVCDALNRELARTREEHSQSDIVSSALGLCLAFMAIVLPVVAVYFVYNVNMYGSARFNVLAFVLMGVGATLWRFASGLFLGYGQSKRMFHAYVLGGIFNLVLAFLCLRAGVRNYAVFATMTPVLLAGVGLAALYPQLRALLRVGAVIRMPSWRPLMAIALPSSLGMLLEPMTVFVVRATTAEHFGEQGVGLIQPGLIFVILGASLLNAFVGMTVTRWDQSNEAAFSRKSMMLLAAACTFPLFGSAFAFLLQPLWDVLVRLFFTKVFLVGAPTVPWFIAGETFRMGGTLLNQTFLSRRRGILSLIPRLVCVGTVAVALQGSFSASILGIAQAYTLAYAALLAVSVAQWLGLHMQLARQGGRSRAAGSPPAYL
jgi:O-antigen/teichoic acid export membrane protein